MSCAVMSKDTAAHGTIADTIVGYLAIKSLVPRNRPRISSEYVESLC